MEIERDKTCILPIPLSSREVKDELIWAFSNNDPYSVKTTYMLGKGGNLDDFHRAWVVLWSMDVSPKVRHFLWRYCKNTLPSREILRTRHLIDNGSCPWCSEAAKTMNHAVFLCPRIANLWRVHGCEDMVSNVEGGYRPVVKLW